MSTPNITVVKRNQKPVAFDAEKIRIAVTKAFHDVDVLGVAAAQSSMVHDKTKKITLSVVEAIINSGENIISIEEIQDVVETTLMECGESAVAKSYILYRNNRSNARMPGETANDAMSPYLQQAKMYCEGFNADPAALSSALDKSVYSGISDEDLQDLWVIEAKALIEKQPDFSFVAARITLDKATNEAYLALALDKPEDETLIYTAYFDTYIRTGIKAELLDEKLADFDLEALSHVIDPSRDSQFTYLSVKTLYDRYFIHLDEKRIELPQAMFMRVAMGLALNEKDKNSKAIEFYQLLSSFDYMASTPTLFNSGTRRPQLSSCYLTTIPDDLEGIYGSIQDNAMLSKWAGGLGNDWTPVRSLGAYIKGTNGKSQGVVPFLKVANDTAVAVNQGGKRKGAVCAYLETWHLDIEEFLELRKNTGDDRRRTHDMNTANWIPDLFMKRVINDEPWTLFSPNETPELHDLYGRSFEKAYSRYEELAAEGKVRNFKTLRAVDLWRKMLGMVFETGHPWITFKDACNVRNPQKHTGVIHSSNLCTEITLNTNHDEIAVCNLGSVNMVAHIKDNKIDTEKLERTVKTAIRMLDNVIDINYYSVDKARNSNLKHRPIGLGMMGVHDALLKMRVSLDSDEAVLFADVSTEMISYYAIDASCKLALERGQYPSFNGSFWSNGILPIHSLEYLQHERGQYLEIDKNSYAQMDWDGLSERVQQFGMRNSNVLAIAPTATIANICGVSQSIEPNFQYLYVKSNLSGEFTNVNPHLVSALAELGMWDEAMVNDLKFYEGSIQNIKRIPDTLKEIFKTAFEIEPKWLIEQAARRQKWIDQAQSLNLYMEGANGPLLDRTYKLAFMRGLKTTYYLRATAATSTEKSTVESSQLNAVSAAPKACLLDDPGCEACQ